MDSFLLKAQDLLIFLPFFMIAVAFHEVAHGYAAFRLGDPTAKNAGRLTLNPMEHIDPVGSIMFLLSFFAGFGFGWAKPVPVDPRYFKNPRRDDIIVSLAGVAANIALVILCIVIMRVFVAINPPITHDTSGVAMLWGVKIIYRFMILNTVLTVFNLLPIPPLDGSHVLMALLPLNQARAYANIRPYGLLIILLLMNTPIMDTLFSAVIGTVVGLTGIYVPGM